MLFTYMLKCPAWLSLSPAARAVYLQLQARYNGSNNGTLAFSVRCAAAECRIAANTATRAFQELQTKGFIENTKLGYFQVKVRHASEWLLTAFRDDRTGEISKRTFMKVQI
jgi:DNA-binding transcriptional regulator YhcF (GntR family)